MEIYSQQLLTGDAHDKAILCFCFIDVNEYVYDFHYHCIYFCFS